MTYRKILKAFSLAGLAAFVVSLTSAAAAHLAQRSKHHESLENTLWIDGLCAGVPFVVVFSLALALLLRKKEAAIVNNNYGDNERGSNLYPPAIIAASKSSSTPISASNPIHIPGSYHSSYSRTSDEENPKSYQNHDWGEGDECRDLTGSPSPIY